MLQWVQNTQETFDVVDKEDGVIRTWLTEEELHINDDITRVVTAYVFDAQGRVYVAQRSPEKVVDPLKYEAPAHGRVNSWESYEDAIVREAKEELWIDVESVQEIAHFYFAFDSNVGIRQHYKKLFIAHTSQEITVNETEIYKIRSFDTIEEYFAFYDSNIELFSNACEFDLSRMKMFFRNQD